MKRITAVLAIVLALFMPLMAQANNLQEIQKHMDNVIYSIDKTSCNLDVALARSYECSYDKTQYNNKNINSFKSCKQLKTSLNEFVKLYKNMLKIMKNEITWNYLDQFPRSVTAFEGIESTSKTLRSNINFLRENKGLKVKLLGD